MHLAGFQTFGCLIIVTVHCPNTHRMFGKPWSKGWGKGEGFLERCGDGRVKDGDRESTGVEKAREISQADPLLGNETI